MGFMEGHGGGFVLTPEEMQAVDREAIEGFKVPGLALMENAARHVARVAAEGLAPGARIGLVCGRGNNGGDGLAAARHLSGWGFSVEVVWLGGPERMSPDARIHLEVAQRAGLRLHAVADVQAVAELPGPGYFAVVVDALLGTGLRGAVGGVAAELIAWMNGHRAPVVAVDVPSGLCGRSGRPLNEAVRAARTVTFGASKTGHWLHPGPEYVGRLEVVDIGLPAGLVAAAGARVVLGDAALEVVRAPREGATHKGRMGHVLVLAGSPGRTGAARLAAAAALRAGAGLVTMATDARVWAALAAQAWEVMAVPGPDPAAPLAADVARLRAEIARCSAAVIGPGLEPGVRTQGLLEGLLPEVARPAVIDAEALNQLVHQPGLLGQGGARVITPHPGEAARLLGCSVTEVQADRLRALDALVERTGAVVVLKGAHTWVGAPDGRRGVCPDGNPGMATAGAGDVLAGVIGALLARGVSPFEAAAAGVVWHARAGDVARAAGTENALSARALIAALPEVERC